MGKRFLRAIYALAALGLASWRWLTPPARVAKGLVLATCAFLAMALVDGLFQLPRLDGWLSLIGLAGAGVCYIALLVRWDDDAYDVPRAWIAPVVPGDDSDVVG